MGVGLDTDAMQHTYANGGAERDESIAGYQGSTDALLNTAPCAMKWFIDTASRSIYTKAA